MTLPREYEEELVERAKKNPEAFGELYDQYVDQIYRFVYSRVRSTEIAQDVTSDVFFKALRAIGRYQSTGRPFSSWLYQISANAVNDYYRSRRHHAELDEAAGVPDAGPEISETVIRRQEAERIWIAIDRLPKQQRTAVSLKLGEDLKLAQIGVIMGKSEGAIKLLIHRGMSTLRSQLQDGGETDERP